MCFVVKRRGMKGCGGDMTERKFFIPFIFFPLLMLDQLQKEGMTHLGKCHVEGEAC